MTPNEKILRTAFNELGVTEFLGKRSNPEIDKYFIAMGFPKEKQNDNTAWCGAFLMWCAWQSGFEFPVDNLTARAWLDVGTETECPLVGDIVVFWRESVTSWKGHVGLFVNARGSNIYVLGGNQDDSVSIKPYPKKQLLGFRRLSTLPRL